MQIIDHFSDPLSTKLSPRFTEKQGQYLAFIYTYTLLNNRPPAESDFQYFFQVTPPSVHQMIINLERLDLISRVPRKSRTVQLLLPSQDLPQLQPIKTSVVRY